MMFFSTRDPEKKLFKASEVIKNGLASDGGLFVPDNIPSVSIDEIANIAKMSYAERAATILSMYLSDYTYEELLEDAKMTEYIVKVLIDTPQGSYINNYKVSGDKILGFLSKFTNRKKQGQVIEIDKYIPDELAWETKY